MKINTLLGAALLAGSAYADADDAQKVLKDESSSIAEAATSAVPLPTFTVSCLPYLAPSHIALRQLHKPDQWLTQSIAAHQAEAEGSLC